jgi:hypothetical protein
MRTWKMMKEVVVQDLKMLSVKQFLTQKLISEIDSPDLAPNDFCFQIKVCLKGMKI